MADLSNAERVAARIALDAIPASAAILPRDGLTFQYPTPPALEWETSFWSAALLAISGYVAVFGHWFPLYGWLALAWAALFTLVVGSHLVLRYIRDRAVVRLTSAGLQFVAPNGHVTGLMWSEIGAVRRRPMIDALDFYTHNGESRGRVWYHLSEFPTFAELTIAHMKRQAAAI